MCLSGFSLAYFHLSKIHPDLAFNTKLTPVSAIYFSIVTFTTAGYGDIYPTSDATKLVVCVELIFTMLGPTSAWSVRIPPSPQPAQQIFRFAARQ